MQSTYQKIKTPYKYGIVFQHKDSSKMIDSPSIFRWENKWWMTYIVFDGRGYETWIAESDNLLNWKSKGRILSFTDSGWDANQKAGYMALLNNKWNGTYAPKLFNGQFWMSYLGGPVKGYEAGQLGVGIAYNEVPNAAQEWNRNPTPVLAANDKNARWFENKTIFKSFIIEDKKRHAGKQFIMYYNASGDTARYESIGMAVSDNMLEWERYGEGPVISRYKKGTICGDAQVVKMGKMYIMFYFGAFWNDDKNAYDRFACSYDRIYAHKPFVIKWKGTVYHFYNAVGEKGRVLALATSRPL